MSDGYKQVRCRIHGQVHNVLFRDFTKRAARLLGLTGYVKNMPDTTVLVVAEGNPDSLQRLIEQLHRGPPMAQVLRVEIQWKAATHEFSSFDIRYES